MCSYDFSIDKAIHSAGPKQGYALAKRSLPNPVDIVLVFSQKVSSVFGRHL